VATIPSFPRLAFENARERFFEKGDFQAVLGHVPDDGLRDFVEWAYWTGMRKGEIRKLTWATFNRETWVLTLPARAPRPAARGAFRSAANSAPSSPATASQSCSSGRRGGRRAALPASRAGSSTTSGVPACATSSAQGCRARSLQHPHRQGTRRCPRRRLRLRRRPPDRTPRPTLAPGSVRVVCETEPMPAHRTSCALTKNGASTHEAWVRVGCVTDHRTRST
jgi:hypothetical protein